jgi:hypothetical protein
VRHHYVSRLFGQRRHQPSEKECRGERASELCNHKARSISGPDTGKVFVKARASVTAGFANDVDAVNH